MRLILLVAALVFALFGVWLTLQPQRIGDWAEVHAPTPTARTEIRAFYGGLELGLAAFLVLAAFRPALAPAACLALGFICAGIAGVRLLGFALDGSYSTRLLLFFLTEAVLAGLGFWGASLARGADA